MLLILLFPSEFYNQSSSDRNHDYFKVLLWTFRSAHEGNKTNTSVLKMLDSEIHSLLENKGGLQVSHDTQFGSLLLGNTKELLIWIQ